MSLYLDATLRVEGIEEKEEEVVVLYGCLVLCLVTIFWFSRASEVTTLWRYTNLFIIIIIIWCFSQGSPLEPIIKLR